MSSYSVYGLYVHSDLPLLGPLPAETAAEPDVMVRLGRVDRPCQDAGSPEGCFYATPDEAGFYWEEGGAYLVRGGQEIVVDPPRPGAEGTVSLIVLGVALGVLLHQRGLLTLHASAVVVDGGAVAFMGGKGEGKSAVAAAFHARGYGVVADDIVALDVGDTAKPMMLPGFPQLKLWPEVAAQFGDAPETLPRLDPLLEKRARPVARDFPQAPLPLHCAYVLDQGDRPEVEALQPQAAFSELMSHSYALRFLGTAGITASHFAKCARLASSVPVRRLKRPPSLETLPAVAQFVEEHLAHCVQGSKG
jgi:hypothetical protein